MMHMLHAGGMEVYAENMDSFETLRNIELPKYDRFLYDCRGKAVKILDPLYFRLPRKHKYRFLWMWRNPQDIVKSQYKFFKLVEQEVPPLTLQSLVSLSNKVNEDYEKSKEMLANYPGSEALVVSFKEVLEDSPRIAGVVAEFLGRDLDAEAMASVVIDREPECYAGFLETKLVEGYA